MFWGLLGGFGDFLVLVVQGFAKALVTLVLFALNLILVVPAGHLYSSSSSSS
jgi:hypothetical protein